MNSAKGATQGTEPWSQQQGYLTEGWRDAADIWHNQKATPWYQGQTYAGPTDFQRDQINATKSTGSTIAGIGQTNASGSQSFLNNALNRAFLGDVDPRADSYSGANWSGSNFTPTSSYRPAQAPSSIGYSTSDKPELMDYRAAGYTGSGMNTPGAPIQFNNHMTGFQNPLSNPTFLAGLEASFTPAIQQFERTTMPQINSAAIQNGAYGGARHDISQGVAAGEFGKNLSDIAARAFMDEYGRERTIGAGQETALTQLEQQTAQRERELASQDWATGEQLATQRYTTTEGLRAGDLGNRNKLNVDWTLGSDKLNLDATLAANRNALEWGMGQDSNALKAALSQDANMLDWTKASDSMGLDWAKSQDALGSERWAQLQDEASKRNLQRDAINADWDRTALGMVPELSQLGTGQMLQGQTTVGQAAGQEQMWNQAQLDDLFNNWQNQQNWQTDQLKNYLSAVQGYNTMGQGPIKNNPLTSIFGGMLGGASGGYGLGKMTGLFGPQAGGLGGALLGGLLGAF